MTKDELEDIRRRLAQKQIERQQVGAGEFEMQLSEEEMDDFRAQMAARRFGSPLPSPTRPPLPGGAVPPGQAAPSLGGTPSGAAPSAQQAPVTIPPPLPTPPTRPPLTGAAANATPSVLPTPAPTAVPVPTRPPVATPVVPTPTRPVATPVSPTPVNPQGPTPAHPSVEPPQKEKLDIFSRFGETMHQLYQRGPGAGLGQGGGGGQGGNEELTEAIEDLTEQVQRLADLMERQEKPEGGGEDAPQGLPHWVKEAKMENYDGPGVRRRGGASPSVPGTRG